MFVLSVYYHSHFIFHILTFLYAVGEYKSRHKKEGPIFTLRKASRWASCVKEYSKDLLVSSSHRWGWGPLDHWVKLVCCVVYIGPGPNELMGLILSGRPAVTEDALQRWALRSPDKGERDLWGGKLDCEEMEYRKLKDLVFIFRIFENVEIDIFLLLFDVWIFSFTASLSGTEFEFVLIQFDGICIDLVGFYAISHLFGLSIVKFSVEILSRLVHWIVFLNWFNNWKVNTVWKTFAAFR